MVYVSVTFCIGEFSMKVFQKLALLGVCLTLFLCSQVEAATHWKQIYQHYSITAGEALTIGQPVYGKASDSKAYKADADGASTYPVIGLVEHTVASGGTALIVTNGILGGQSSLTVGKGVYLSTTSGGLTQVQVNAYTQPLGYAVATTKYYIDVKPYSPFIGVRQFNYLEEWTKVLDATNDWVVTTAEAGAGSATETIQDSNWGVIRITNAAGDDDLDSIQSKYEFTKLVASKDTWFEVRFRINDATEADVILGLCIRDTTPLAATDYVYFVKDDDDTNWDFVAAKDSSETEVATVDTADTSWHTFSIHADGITNLTPYIDGVAGTTITTAGSINDDEEMAITVHLENGEAVAKWIEIDYIRVQQDR